MAGEAHDRPHRGGAVVGPLLQTEEDVLELHHPRVGEEQGRVAGGHQGGAGHDGMPAFGEELKKRFSDSRPGPGCGCHRSLTPTKTPLILRDERCSRGTTPLPGRRCAPARRSSRGYGRTPPDSHLPASSPAPGRRPPSRPEARTAASSLLTAPGIDPVIAGRSNSTGRVLLALPLQPERRPGQTPTHPTT